MPHMRPPASLAFIISNLHLILSSSFEAHSYYYVFVFDALAYASPYPTNYLTLISNLCLLLHIFYYSFFNPSILKAPFGVYAS